MVAKTKFLELIESFKKKTEKLFEKKKLKNFFEKKNYKALLKKKIKSFFEKI